MPTWNPQANDLFLKALEMPSGDDRRAYLAGACAGDTALRAEVEALLEASARAGSFLESPASAPGVTVDAAPVAESPGTVIGPYRLLQQLGEGGMGTVFMAEQTQPVQRKVALKIIKPGMDSRQVIARFEAERQALALMDHPNIAKVLDAGTTDTGRPYFVMELVKGVPITRYCDEHRLTPKQRLELFVPVCQAVQHAHQKGIIHRDLKPSNVMVCLYDGKPVPKVIDFGIAKATGQKLTERTLFTEIGQVVGTLEYMSPEQAELNQLDIDTRSDIYSLGVLLYELLTGSTPLERTRLKAAAMLEVLRLIREEEPPRPSTRLSTTDELPSVAANRGLEPKKLSGLVRGELDWIVMKALEKDRNRRYETANGFAQDIARYLADEPVLACPPSAWYRFQKFARRNKARLAVAAGVFLALTVMAASIGWAARDRAAREEEIEQAEIARRAEVVRAETARRGKVETQVRDSLNTARALIGENKLAAGRQKLAEARAQLGNDRSALVNLAAAVKAGAAELDRFQEFLDLIDRAHQAETTPVHEAALAADGPHGKAGTLPPKTTMMWRPAAAVPFLLQALQRYEILERDDWNTTLKGSLLGADQVKQIRRTAYEELLWLANDVFHREEEHRSGNRLSPQEAARHALVYLGKAQTAHVPTLALYSLRARCRKKLGEEAAYRADWELAAKTPPTLALDHYLRGEDLRGQATFSDKQLAAMVRAYEAALRLEPTHYWSLMRLGHCWCDFGQRPEDFGTAAAIFTGCILKRPDHAHAYRCRGNAYLSLGRYEEAVADYSRAIELDPRHARDLSNRGKLYRDLGQLDKSLDDVSRAIELDPKYVRAWINRALIYLDLGQRDKAVADLSRAIEVDPKYAVAWYNRGSAYFQLGQAEKAVANFSRAIELDPKFAAAWNYRGLAYRKLGQLEKAIANFSRAIELDPKDANPWHNRGNAYYRDQDHAAKAVADYSEAVALNPKLTAGWTNRGLAYLKLGQPAKAVADLSRAIELDPRDAKAWHNRGVAYSKLGQPAKAVADFSEAIALDPKLVAARNDRGPTYLRLGQSDKAIADCSMAIKLAPTDANAWYSRGLVYGGLGQYDKAVADYSKAIELDPKHVFAWNNRGAAYCDHLGQRAKAVADFSRAIELNSKHLSAWFNRGNAYLHLGQLAKAITDFSKVIELHPTLANAWNNRGAAYLKLGQYDKAVTDWSRAIELEPKFSYAWGNRGRAYLKLGRYDKALADCSRAIDLAPKNVAALNDRGLAYSHLGRFPEALADFQRILKMLPAYAGIHNTMARLLATFPDPKLRDPGQAVKLAKKAVQLAPKDRDCWNTLGAAHYRAGDYQAAVAALDKSRELSKGGDAGDFLFLAMAHGKLGRHDEARKWYDQAVTWLDTNKERLEKDMPLVEELRRFRSEADEVLELKKK
jgi:tetratricopeptide (TPR) repeat protein